MGQKLSFWPKKAWSLLFKGLWFEDDGCLSVRALRMLPRKGCSCVVHSRHPSKDGHPGRPGRDFAVIPQGTLSPRRKLHAPPLQLSAHTASHVSPIARRTPAPVRSGTWPGYQEWCEAVNSLDCLWYMMWGGRSLDGGRGCEDYWAFHFQFPDSPLWQRRWAWL